MYIKRQFELTKVQSNHIATVQNLQWIYPSHRLRQLKLHPQSHYSITRLLVENTYYAYNFSRWPTRKGLSLNSIRTALGRSSEPGSGSAGGAGAELARWRGVYDALGEPLAPLAALAAPSADRPDVSGSGAGRGRGRGSRGTNLYTCKMTQSDHSQ